MIAGNDRLGCQTRPSRQIHNTAALPSMSGHYQYVMTSKGEKRHSALQRQVTPCYKGCAQITENLPVASVLSATLRAARTGHDNDQGGRRLWIRSDATYWQRAPRRRRWPQRRACLLSRLGREELPCPSTKKAPFASTIEEAGSGFPLLLIAGGGLNSTISGLTRGSPFNPIEEFKGEYRCIASDLRNANGGQSSGPLEIDRPWDAYTDDHLGLMDHLGIDKFMVMGFCIGGPFIWNLLKRAPDRIVAAVLAQPSGSRPEMRDLFYETNMKGWGPELIKRRPEITMEMVDKFLTKMYRTNPDFVFTVTRDFVRNCQTPVLILPDDIPAHPYAVAMEAAMLAPKAEVSMFPWKEPKERIPLAVRQIRSFLRAHRPASA